ncbi:hypothetical protein [Stagnihabitans tardus]|uniref:Uncharacterized protein n=1 Tax=Stagnihabitans tardus TaxID=2699202 RepID=A0AAE5BUQ4_9RHOB|nr:hypothetical protein [Stagnihabitans tardus]NBZ88146.1 hypothetical protein [Stagnihabitans tardus]
MRQVLWPLLLLISLSAGAQEIGAQDLGAQEIGAEEVAAGLLERAWAAALLSGDDPRACPEVIGKGLARRLSQYCLYWSGSAHPTCAGDLDCHFIAATIAMNCPPFDGEDPLPVTDVPCISKMDAEDWENLRGISTIGPRIIIKG